jgi:hypothetical protein
MASPLTFAAAIAVAVAVAGLMWMSAKRNGRVLLQRDFAAGDEPPVSLIPCDVRFPLDESASHCLVSATAAGWYMGSPADAGTGWRWTSTRFYLKQPVLIPWARLKYGPARFPATNWYRFDVTGTSIVFFVRKGAAEAALAQRQR